MASQVPDWKRHIEALMADDIREWREIKHVLAALAGWASADEQHVHSIYLAVVQDNKMGASRHHPMRVHTIHPGFYFDIGYVWDPRNITGILRSFQDVAVPLKFPPEPIKTSRSLDEITNDISNKLQFELGDKTPQDMRTEAANGEGCVRIQKAPVRDLIPCQLQREVVRTGVIRTLIQYFVDQDYDTDAIRYDVQNGEQQSLMRHVVIDHNDRITFKSLRNCIAQHGVLRLAMHCSPLGRIQIVLDAYYQTIKYTGSDTWNDINIGDIVRIQDRYEHQQIFDDFQHVKAHIDADNSRLNLKGAFPDHEYLDIARTLRVVFKARFRCINIVKCKAFHRHCRERNTDKELHMFGIKDEENPTLSEKDEATRAEDVTFHQTCDKIQFRRLVESVLKPCALIHMILLVYTARTSYS